ncbi:MAG: TIGR03620 family F420-dependent LLM class oxidoreductase [Gammaproteobacteria bacterium]|nr:TIGR03620 family F420-dependent LLM class oxidoreductase [Gammaproteobacteria bacterium]
MNLTQRGVFMFNEGIPSTELKRAVQRIESLGYGAVWFPEAIGREPLATASFILAHTERLIAATGILNIYGRDPMVTAMGQQTLAEQSGGRFLLGLGVSHSLFVEPRGHVYGKPVATMRSYVAALRQCHTGISVTKSLALDGFAPQLVGHGERGAITTDLGEMPVVLAALGPKMNALAAEIAQGSHPYNTTPDHTRRTRQILGPRAWLCPMQRVCLTTDARRAREVGRRVLSLYLELPNYRNMLFTCGFTEGDMESGGSDRLIDQLLGWGNETAIRAAIQAHLDAGANHVCVQAINLEDPVRPCFRALEALAA